MALSTNPKPLVLMLPKWWPDPVRFHDGIFTKRQAEAVRPWWRVACVHVHPHDTDFQVSEEGGVFVVRVGIGRCSGLKKLMRARQAYKRGYDTVKSALGKPELVHAHILLLPALFAYWMRLVLGIPYVVSEHWSGYATGEYAQRGPLYRMMTRRVARRARAVVAPSKFLAAAMQSCGIPGHYAVVPNVVAVPDGESVRSAPGHGMRMVNVSDMWDDKKNISGLIRAVAVLIADDPRFTLHIVGDGRDKSTLIELARELGVLDKHVFFLGEIPGPETLALIRGSDFYVMNSRVETFSIAPAEALACGKPVIVTDCGGPVEYVTEAVGILVPKDDLDALVGAMRRMGARFSSYDPDLLKRCVRERLAPDVVGRRLADVYDAAVR